MLLPIFLSLFSLSHALDPTTVVDSNGITLWEKIEEMERLLMQPATLSSDVSPCDFNVGSDAAEEQQTSAEWVRIVFHDSITKGIAGPGLGGLDASIGFESNRPENVGRFVNATLGQFSSFQSVFLSMSDLIGVGLSAALATCGNDHRRLPLRVGRVDATGPGLAGVPGPGDSLAFATAAFNRAGFSDTEMIQAVACGHSLGGVHGIDFPDIGAPSTDENTSGRITFDSTPAVFDNANVLEYLGGTGNRGGPLVVGQNVTENSDLRIFSSDGNATITAMSSATAFENTCFTIFDKMLNTIPSAVTLSDPFSPRPWSMGESHLDLTPGGEVNFTGTITAHATTEPPNTASYTYMTVGGGNIGPKTSNPGTVLGGFVDGFPSDDPISPANLGFGVLKQYTFGDIIYGQPTTEIVITSSGSTYNGTINTNIFILPSQSFGQVDPTGVGLWNVRVAILNSLATTASAPVITVWYALPQQGTVSMKIVSATATMAYEKTLGSYKIFKASNFQGPAPLPSIGTEGVFQVKLGTTLTSAKVKSDQFQPGCGENDVSLC